ncbi:MAG: glycosyltransferase [Aquificales bacterium]|nr:glycosyltransferase [Aquificales bacterium]
MNILFISPLYPPATGGAATYARHIVDGFKKNRCVTQFHLLTEHLPNQEELYVEDGLYIHRQLPSRISVKQKSRLGHIGSYLQTQLWFVLHLSQLVKKYDIHLIHFHTRYRGRVFYQSLKQSGLPILADMRDKMLDPNQLIDTASHIICNSESVEQGALSSDFPANKVTLIPVAFTPPKAPSPEMVDKIHRKYAIKQKYILYVGDMTYNKGVYDLIEAHQAWRHDVLLLLAGTNREGGKFEHAVRQATNVVLLGRVPAADAIGLISGAEILVLPSRSEALGQVILEAVSLGTKVICPPNIPEYERYLPEFTLTAVTPPAITEKLTVIWDSPTLPVYPLGRHKTEGIINSLTELYCHLLPDC